MSEEELAFILKYSKPKEILIINYENRLLRLICPFLVEARVAIGDLQKGKKYPVDGVLVDDKIITVYKIINKHYYYYHFFIC